MFFSHFGNGIRFDLSDLYLQTSSTYMSVSEELRKPADSALKEMAKNKSWATHFLGVFQFTQHFWASLFEKSFFPTKNPHQSASPFGALSTGQNPQDEIRRMMLALGLPRAVPLGFWWRNLGDQQVCCQKCCVWMILGSRVINRLDVIKFCQLSLAYPIILQSMFTSFFASPNRWEKLQFCRFRSIFVAEKCLQVDNRDNMSRYFTTKGLGEGQLTAKANATEKSIPAPRNR